MDPPGWLASIKGPALSYGLPLVGFGVGLAVGDIIHLGDKIKEWTAQWIDLGNSAKMLGALTYFLIGLALWMAVPHIGALIGGAFMGMALRAFTGTGTTQAVA